MSCAYAHIPKSLEQDAIIMLLSFPLFNMTPELRKEASELILHKRGIRINVQLHVIEADEEVTLRNKDEVCSRLIALWAVSTAAQKNETSSVFNLLKENDLLSCLSSQELAFLSNSSPSSEEQQRFLSRHHSFIFLAWCAGLVPNIHLLPKPIHVDASLIHFPQLHHNSTFEKSALSNSIQLRRKDSVMDWSDLLYRLHWAVRHATLTNKPSPGMINGDLVREWHQTVNWLCHYDDEDNWDLVSTETSA